MTARQRAYELPAEDPTGTLLKLWVVIDNTAKEDAAYSQPVAPRTAARIGAPVAWYVGKELPPALSDALGASYTVVHIPSREVLKKHMRRKHPRAVIVDENLPDDVGVLALQDAIPCDATKHYRGTDPVACSYLPRDGYRVSADDSELLSQLGVAPAFALEARVGDSPVFEKPRNGRDKHAFTREDVVALATARAEAGESYRTASGSNKQFVVSQLVRYALDCYERTGRLPWDK